MENLCYFVNSRGLLKSCTFHATNPISSSSYNRFYLDIMIKSNKMFNGMSIYVCSDLLKHFVRNILPNIKKIFVLVSGDSDLCVPSEILSESETFTLLNSQFLIKWFAQNTRIQSHPKIVQLPIGLDYHTISNNPNSGWISQGEGRLPRDQEHILINIKNNSVNFYERIPKIYVNFSMGNDRFNQRKNSLRIIPNDLLVINESNLKRTQTWNNIVKYSFVLSPFGIGMDCHRTWEALCLGSIPILKAPNFKKMFEELPVLIVNEWEEINEKLLLDTLELFKDKSFNYDKLTMKYWVNRISLLENF